MLLNFEKEILVDEQFFALKNARELASKFTPASLPGSARHPHASLICAQQWKAPNVAYKNSAGGFSNTQGFRYHIQKIRDRWEILYDGIYDDRVKKSRPQFCEIVCVAVKQFYMTPAPIRHLIVEAAKRDSGKICCDILLRLRRKSKEQHPGPAADLQNVLRAQFANAAYSLFQPRPHFENRYRSIIIAADPAA